MSLRSACFSCFTSTAVESEPSTQSFSNELYSSTVWSSRSLRSIRKMTLSTLGSSRRSCASLKDVSVLPEPVHAKTYPFWFDSSTRRFAAFTAKIWYGRMTISTGSVVLMTMYLSSISVMVERRRNSAVNSSSLLMRLLFSSVQKNTRLFRIGL